MRDANGGIVLVRKNHKKGEEKPAPDALIECGKLRQVLGILMLEGNRHCSILIGRCDLGMKYNAGTKLEIKTTGGIVCWSVMQILKGYGFFLG